MSIRQPKASQPELRGEDFIATTELYGRGGVLLAKPGETCEKVFENSRKDGVFPPLWLIEQRLIVLRGR